MFSPSSPGARRSGNRGRRRNNIGPTSSSFSWGTTLVTTAFVAYGTYKLANWIYDAWIDDENENNSNDKEGNASSAEQNVHDRHRGDTTTGPSTTTTSFRNVNSNRTWLLRRQRMKRCRQETIQALQGFLPTLGRIVEEQTKTTLETHALKKIRAQRRKLQQQQQQLQSPGTAAAASPSSSNKGDSSAAAATGHDGDMSPPVTPLKDDDGEKNINNNNNNREQEVQLWNVIKIQSVTRLMATAYAHTVLFLVLTVQVHLLGAHLWNEQLLLQQQQQQQLEQGESSTTAGAGATTVSSPSSSSTEFSSKSSGSNNDNSSGSCDTDYSYQESHRYVLLHTYEYFFEQGLGLLIQTVERAVEQVLQDWNVLDPAFLHVSHATLDQAIDQIRLVVEELHSTSSSSNKDESDPIATPGGGGGGVGGLAAQRRRHCPRNLLRFLMPPTATSSDQKTSSNDQSQQGSAVDAAAAGDAKSKDALKVAQAILDETWDLLESPVLKDAQQDCLNATFDLLRQESWGPIFHNETTNADDHHHQVEATTTTTTTTRPLAHILTQLKKASSSFYVTVNNNNNSNQDMATVDVQPIVVNSYCQAMEQLPSVLEVGDVSFN